MKEKPKICDGSKSTGFKNDVGFCLNLSLNAGCWTQFDCYYATGAAFGVNQLLSLPLKAVSVAAPFPENSPCLHTVASLSLKKNTIYKEKYFPFPSWPDSWHIQMYSRKVKKKPNILVCVLLKECISQTSGCTSTFILWRWQCHTDLFLFLKRWIDRDYFVFLYFFFLGGGRGWYTNWN